jgi:hypothetical protein
MRLKWLKIAVKGIYLTFLYQEKRLWRNFVIECSYLCRSVRVCPCLSHHSSKSNGEKSTRKVACVSKKVRLQRFGDGILQNRRNDKPIRAYANYLFFFQRQIGL